MPAPKTLPELTELIRRLGARDSDAWASSQIEEGIPQLACFLCLRQAWRQVVREDACDWIEEEIERSLNGPDDPFATVGHALTGLRAKGSSTGSMARVVASLGMSSNEDDLANFHQIELTAVHPSEVRFADSAGSCVVTLERREPRDLRAAP